MKYTFGVSNATARSELQSSLQVDGGVGFNGTPPIAKRAASAPANDLASVITLANALLADLQAYGLKS